MGATSATYTPRDADKTRFLRAEATYIDAMSNRDMGSTPNVDERVQSAIHMPPGVPAETIAEDTDNHRVYKVGA